MSKLHCMIDLETWGKKPNAQIISIGAVKFDPLDPTGPFDNFHVAVDPRGAHESYTKLFDIDPDTILWWMDRERDTARTHWLRSIKLDLPTALAGFTEWFGPESMPTWGNGATFDNVILLTALGLTGMPRPWHYGHDRCYRTLKNLAPHVKGPSGSKMLEFMDRDAVPSEERGVPHTALYDAQWQAIHTRLLMQELMLVPGQDISGRLVPIVEGTLAPDLPIVGHYSDGDLPLAEELHPDDVQAMKDYDGFEPDEGAVAARQAMMQEARQRHIDDPDLKHRARANLDDAVRTMRSLPEEPAPRATVLSPEQCRKLTDHEIRNMLHDRRGASPIDPTLLNLQEEQRRRTFGSPTAY